MRGGLAIVAMLLVLPVASAWTTHHGGADRNGAAILPPGPLDVLGNDTFSTTSVLSAYWGMAAFATRDAWYAPAYLAADGTCRLLTFTTTRLGGLETNSKESVLDGCMGLPQAIAFDEPSRRLFICNGLLTAHNVDDASLWWSFDPSTLGGVTPTGNRYWACAAGAYDAATDTLFVPFTTILRTNIGAQTDSRDTNRLAAFDGASGALKWALEIRLPEEPAVKTATGPVANPGNLVPLSATLTVNGIIVTGYTNRQCRVEGVYVGTAQTPCEEGFAAWFTRDGRQRGIERAVSDRTDLAQQSPTAVLPRAVSQYAVAKGAVGAVALGNRILLINPENAEPVGQAPLVAFESVQENVFHSAPSWRDDVIVFGLPHGVTAYSAATLERTWSWTGGVDVDLVDLIQTANGEFLLLTRQETTGLATLARLDATGRDKGSLDLPLVRDVETRGAAWVAHVIPIADRGLVVMTNRGEFVVLGEADASLLPHVGLDTTFPAPGARVAFTQLSGPPGLPAREFIIDWGDGTRERITNLSAASHIFAARGVKDVSVTAIYPNGLTATRVLAIDVGGTPPPELTPLQRAFSPENYDLTFGLLGVGLTLIGAIYTVGRTRARVGRLERELNAIEEIRVLSLSDPRESVRALRAYRDRLPTDLARRRIDDSQYHVLDVRSARLLKLLRTRLFAPYETRFSSGLLRLMDAAFEDAVLQPGEREALVQAIAREDFTPEERAEMSVFLDDFTSDPRIVAH